MFTASLECIYLLLCVVSVILFHKNPNRFYTIEAYVISFQMLNLVIELQKQIIAEASSHHKSVYNAMTSSNAF